VRPISKPRSLPWIFAALAISLAGCFASPDLSQISCQTSDQCAPGYQCDEATKKCRPGRDAAANNDAVRDSVAPPTDADAASSPDGNLPDLIQQPDLRAADVSSLEVDAPVDLGQDIPDDVILEHDVRATADTAVIADLGRDLGADIGPDLGPDLGPDSSLAGDTAGAGLSIGSACGKASDCALGNCVDGVCCKTACTGVCESCALAASKGTCSLVTGTAVPAHGSCNGAGECGGRCNGKSSSCVYPNIDTSCGSPSCSSGTATPSGSCNGVGACNPGQSKSCGDFACGTDACLTSCTSNGQCASGAACVGSTCTKCSAGQTVCANACIDVQNSDDHCGSCTAAACGTGEHCKGGKCLLQDGRPCTTASQCASGVCPMFYLDADGDGYPDKSSGKGYCNVSAPPSSSYVIPRSDGEWDCYDSDGTVNPGVTDYFDSPNAAYGWDWNCSGSLEKQKMDVVTCLPNAAKDNCESGMTTGNPSEDCGSLHILPGCAASSMDPLTCLQFSGDPGGTVKCH
jgi:hypothetical protein